MGEDAVEDINEHRPLKPGEMYRSRIGKIRRFRESWHGTRQDEHAPFCCALRTSLWLAWRDGKITTMKKFPGIKRGTRKRGKDEFVPCGIFHHATKEEKS